MRKRSMIVASAVALVAVGVFAGVSLAGDNGPAQERAKVLKPVIAVASPPGDDLSRPATKPKGHHKGKKKPTIQFFFAGNRTVPPEGGGVVTALRCPTGKGEPIAGGADTQEGIVVSYLSRVSPSGKTPSRTYYIGVDDNSDDPGQDGSGAYAEIQCAKDISVKHP